MNRDDSGITAWTREMALEIEHHRYRGGTPAMRCATDINTPYNLTQTFYVQKAATTALSRASIQDLVYLAKLSE